jgi:hypothetical protein
MSKANRDSQSNEQLLYTMLCALIKKSDGEIRIGETEMDSIGKRDNMMVYHDKDNKEIILTLHLLNSPVQDEVF